MRQFFGVCVAAGFVLSALPASSAAEPAGRTAPCARTTIAARKLPVGPAQYESGSLTLGNGASLRLQGTPAEMYRVKAMTIGDPVAACYGPRTTYADAGPARTITVLDLRNGEYFASLIGNWKTR